MKTLLSILPGFLLAGCVILLPEGEISFQGMHAGHRILKVSCPYSLNRCKIDTLVKVTEKCDTPIWRVVLQSEAYGASQYWVECSPGY